MAIAIAVGLVTSEIILAWFGAGAPGRRCQPLLSQRAVVHFASLRAPERLARQLKRQTHKTPNAERQNRNSHATASLEIPNEPSPQNSRSTIV